MIKFSLMTLSVAAALAIAGCNCKSACTTAGKCGADVPSISIPANNWATSRWTPSGTPTFEVKENSVILNGPGWISKRTEFPFAGTDPELICNGFSFRVRGDGSDDWGCISITDGGRLRSAYYFPLNNKDWTEHKVAFADMAPAYDNASRLPDKIRVGELTFLAIGDYWKIRTGNLPRAKFTYEISDLKLETNVPAVYQRGKYRPMPLKDAVEKMKSGKPVSISCFGDSITAGTGLANRAATRYATLIGPALAKFYKNDQIKSVCAATGGAHTFQSIGWLERDLAEGGMPDVVTMLIGFNNCSGGQTAEFYREQLIEWIERITFRTRGKCAILLVPTIPGVPRFHTQEYMAAETRKIAEEYGCTVIPLDTIIRNMGPLEYKKFLCDTVHPNEEGHKFFTDVIFETITGEKR